MSFEFNLGNLHFELQLLHRRSFHSMTLFKFMGFVVRRWEKAEAYE
jgi:hypothetical protein